MALKAKVPVATLDPTCKWVSSKDQAAVDAFNATPPGKLEQSGAIYKNKEGEFCYSVPVPGKEKSFQFKTDQSGGLKFDGIYHTHPSSGHNDFGVSSDNFSPDDVAIANRMNRDSYIRVDRTGETKKFSPGVTAIDPHTKASRGTLLASVMRNDTNNL